MTKIRSITKFFLSWNASYYYYYYYYYFFFLPSVSRIPRDLEKNNNIIIIIIIIHAL